MTEPEPVLEDPFRLKRQPCRCGETFATLQAFLVHADYGEPLPHDDPAKIGLHLEGGEWTHILPPDDTDLTKHAGSKTRAPKAKPRVRAADRPDSDFEVTCPCGKVFLRPRGRGRPPKRCPECRGA